MINLKPTKKEIIVFIFLFILILWLGKNVFLPAYRSYKLACKPEEVEDVCLGGEFVFNRTTNQSEIIIYGKEGTLQYNQSLKHEISHYKQSKRSGLFRLYNCSSPLGVYLNELESYLSEYF